MKTFNTQKGFFDLGISLGLLAIFGSTAAVVTTERNEQTTVVEQQMQVEQAEIPTEIIASQSLSE